MPRDLPIGNVSLLVAFDSHYRIADFYFPHVGMENHAASRFRFGVWADDRLSWIEDPSWQKKLTYLRDTLVTDVLLQNDEPALRLRCYDAVDAEASVFVRKIVVRNLRGDARRIKLFFHQDFNLYGNPICDTPMFDPESRAIIHYKAHRYLLVNAATEGNVGIGGDAGGRPGACAARGS